MEVTSEILPTFESDLKSKPSLNQQNQISKFRVTHPQRAKLYDTPVKDEDGDYIVDRQNEEKTFLIEHSLSTSLHLVGLQVWRGALLLSDLVIHLRNDLLGKTVVELGAGVGLTSLVAALYAEKVICTDLDTGGILDLLRHNVKRNKDLLHGEIQVHGLDWFDTNWSEALQNEIEEASVILAADVIYDNRVTEAFIRTITKILSSSPKKTMYIALEKRYVFTMADLDTVAPCYEHLLTCLDSIKYSPPWSEWIMVPVPIDFPQRISYERLKQMVIWKIST